MSEKTYRFIIKRSGDLEISEASLFPKKKKKNQSLPHYAVSLKTTEIFKVDKVIGTVVLYKLLFL